MEVPFTATQEAALRQLATHTGRNPEELVQEAVEQLLDYDRWFHEQVQFGLEQIARGEFVPHEEVGERIRQVLRS